MLPNPRSDTRAFTLGLIGIALVTLWRVALLPLNRADLFVDDAQYWFWGQELAWGYYSKPPLIGWILRASTEIGGDGMFWIRLPMALIHAATAILVALIGRRLFGDRIGGLAGFAFATLPAVALASLLVSTDTPMLFCFALAMLAQLHLTQRRSIPWALTLGAAIGTGLLAKYAMIYFPISAALAALLLPSARISWRDAGLAALLAAALIAPNLWWNATNSFATLHHTADNADLDGFEIFPLGLLKFWAGQFAVSGPILFTAALLALRGLRRDPTLRYLALMALPVLGIVSVQALISPSGANANWAAAGHIAAVIAGVSLLASRRFWLRAALGLNLAISLGLPVATIFADSLRLGSGDLVMERYVGRADLSRHAAEIARGQGIGTLVSDNRALLADFFYTLRDSGLRIYAAPVEGFPPHHYAQKHPLTPGEGDVLFIGRDPAGPVCKNGAIPRLVTSWTPAQGFITTEVFAFRLPRACWFPAVEGEG